MPYTGNEGNKGERAKPKCPLCKKDMTFICTDEVSGLGGYHCPACDNVGLTGCHKRGNQIVGRP